MHCTIYNTDTGKSYTAPTREDCRGREDREAFDAANKHKTLVVVGRRIAVPKEAH